MLRKYRILTIFSAISLITAVILFYLGIDPIKAYFNQGQGIVVEEIGDDSLVIVQDNTLVSINSPTTEVVKKKMNVVITAYSSCPFETNSSPFITASGKFVEHGIVANNLFPFGTRIRIPELYGDEIFVIQDRMHPRKGYYHVDIWFSSKEGALEFGSKRTYIEVLAG